MTCFAIRVRHTSYPKSGRRLSRIDLNWRVLQASMDREYQECQEWFLFLTTVRSEAYLVDVVFHPRDLNLAFVAISTGVVLFNLVSSHLFLNMCLYL